MSGPTRCEPRARRPYVKAADTDIRKTFEAERARLLPDVLIASGAHLDAWGVHLECPRHGPWEPDDVYRRRLLALLPPRSFNCRCVIAPVVDGPVN